MSKASEQLSDSGFGEFGILISKVIKQFLQILLSGGGHEGKVISSAAAEWFEDSESSEY